MSTGDESSRFARYAFRRHFYQHASFRLVRSLDTSATLPVALMCGPTGIVEGMLLGVNVTFSKSMVLQHLGHRCVKL